MREKESKYDTEFDVCYVNRVRDGKTDPTVKPNRTHLTCC